MNDYLYFYFLQKMVSKYQVLHAARSGNINNVRLLLQHGAEINNMVILHAASNGYIDIVRLLLQHGAEIHNLTVLYAARKGYTDIVRLLLQHGAEIDGMTVPHVTHEGHIKSLKIIIAYQNIKKIIRHFLNAICAEILMTKNHPNIDGLLPKDIIQKIIYILDN